MNRAIELVLFMLIGFGIVAMMLTVTASPVGSPCTGAQVAAGWETPERHCPR